jgi:hypothetical protein
MTDKYDIKQLLSRLYLPPNETEIESQYFSTFFSTGAKKAKRYEEYLRRTISSAEQKEFVFLSIGGADGSELEYIARNFEFQSYILCEYSIKAAESAKKLSDDLKESGRTLDVLVGDVWSKRHAIKQLIDSKKGAYGGVVVSAQSVLHELPTRSIAKDFPSLFLQLVSFSENTVFLSSDPTGNTVGWPEKVAFHAKQIAIEDLYQLSRHIHEKYFQTDEQPELIGDRVVCTAKIALEVFYKTAYLDGINRLNYELGECLSCFPRREIEKILSAQKFRAQFSSWQSDRLISSFNENYEFFEITSSNLLSLPETFVSIFAENLKKN